MVLSASFSTVTASCTRPRAALCGPAASRTVVLIIGMAYRYTFVLLASEEATYD